MSQPTVNDAIEQAITGQKTLQTDDLYVKLIRNEPSKIDLTSLQAILARDYLNAANNGTQREYLLEKGQQVRNGPSTQSEIDKFLDAQILEQRIMLQAKKHMDENPSNKSVNLQDVQNTVAKALVEDKVPDNSYEMRNGAFREIMSREKNQTSTHSQDIELK